MFNAVFRIQPATNGGTGPWALSFMTAIPKCNHDFSTEEVILIFECLKSLANSSYIGIPAIDFWLSMYLDYGNNFIICTKGLLALKTLVSKYVKVISDYFSENDLIDILRWGAKSNAISKKEVLKCQSVLNYGTYGIQIEKPEKYLFLPELVIILKEKNK